MIGDFLHRLVLGLLIHRRDHSGVFKKKLKAFDQNFFVFMNLVLYYCPSKLSLPNSIVVERSRPNYVKKKESCESMLSNGFSDLFDGIIDNCDSNMEIKRFSVNKPRKLESSISSLSFSSSEKPTLISVAP